MQIEVDIVNYHQNEDFNLNNSIWLYFLGLIHQVIFFHTLISYINNSHIREVIIIVLADHTYLAHYRPSSLYALTQLIMSTP